MKVLDVTPFQEGIQRNITMLSRLEGEMKAIETAVSGLVSMEASFSGQGANAIRTFYNDCHLPLLQFFATFKPAFESTLTSMKSALDSLEPNANGYIKQTFLEGEVVTGLTDISKTTTTFTTETNDIIAQVSDIVVLPQLDDTDLQDGVTSAKKKSETTVTDLGEFDSTQTSELTTIENDLQMMQLWLNELEGLMNDGLTGTEFPTNLWAQYIETHPMKTTLEARTPEVCVVEDGLETEEVYAPNPTLENLSESVSATDTITNNVFTNGVSSFKMFMAGLNDGLTTSKHLTSDGTYSYRINATGQAMAALGVSSTLNQGGILKYASQKTGQTGWSSLGNAALKKHPNLAFWNDGSTAAQKAKVIGTATVKGTGKAFTDLVDVKGIVTSGPLKGAGKALGPLGAGLNYYGNYSTAKVEGLSDGEAHGRAAVDTAIDVAVGGAVQTAFTVGFTAIIPIPGVGTAVGIGFGILANVALNTKIRDSDKSVMDHIKGWFH
ncbi:MAG: LXG domain-containing protein [Bacillus sp. (in: Bacteria)]|nr:LXG domain-containing protein [Bacillus sp. (in: firmicutes)]